MPALDLGAFMAQLRVLQQKETITEILAEPLGRGLLAAAVGLLFVVLLLVGPKTSEDKSELDKALRGKPKPAQLRGYTRAEVAKHTTEGDLWLILKNKNKGSDRYMVYDVSSYVDHHPGGDAIFTHAGDDCTEGFHGIQHPPTVFDLVEEYVIGWLEEGGEEAGGKKDK
ncbi:hypothetical protein ABPG75_000325 [Micractinium tetrahymenae]